MPTLAALATSVGVLAVQHADPRPYDDVEIEALQTVAMVLSELIAHNGLVDEEHRTPAWDGQFRQPILIATDKVPVSISPQRGFQHASHPEIEADTLDAAAAIAAVIGAPPETTTVRGRPAGWSGWSWQNFSSNAGARSSCSNPARIWAASHNALGGRQLQALVGRLANGRQRARGVRGLRLTS